MAEPPFYVLVARSSMSNPNAGTSSNTLGHPTIQYHYADDSPVSLWPQHSNEHVLVLDFDPTLSKPPTVQSLSEDLIISGLKIEEAPGAAATEENVSKNDRMYIIDTTMSEVANDIAFGDHNSAYNALIQFRRRNTVLRRALSYPGIPIQSNILLPLWAPSTSFFRPAQ